MLVWAFGRAFTTSSMLIKDGVLDALFCGGGGDTMLDGTLELPPVGGNTVPIDFVGTAAAAPFVAGANIGEGATVTGLAR